MGRILLIDDNVALRDLMALALERAGHTVLTAGTGKEGILLLRQNSVDALVTDVVMPDQDGLETLQQARRLRPDLRIVVISGDSPRHAPLYLKIAGHLGAHQTLQKPFAIPELLAAVEPPTASVTPRG